MTKEFFPHTDSCVTLTRRTTSGREAPREVSTSNPPDGHHLVILAPRPCRFRPKPLPFFLTTYAYLARDGILNEVVQRGILAQRHTRERFRKFGFFASVIFALRSVEPPDLIFFEVTSVVNVRQRDKGDDALFIFLPNSPIFSFLLGGNQNGAFFLHFLRLRIHTVLTLVIVFCDGRNVLFL